MKVLIRSEKVSNRLPGHLAAVSIAFLLAPIVACLAATSEQAVSSTIQGSWSVLSVEVDRGAMRTLQYQLDDPRLVGRVFRIKSAEIEARTPEHLRCAEPHILHQSESATDLIRTSMGARAEENNLPGPTDYALKFVASNALDVMWISCASGKIGPDLPGPANSNWFVMSEAKLYLRWFDSTILILSREIEGSVPHASFDCRKAGSPTEKAICSSTELAAYDRSVASAYSGALKDFEGQTDEDALKQTRAQQKYWLAARDACGSDVECLTKQMENRLEALLGPS